MTADVPKVSKSDRSKREAPLVEVMRCPNLHASIRVDRQVAELADLSVMGSGKTEPKQMLVFGKI